jgi:hypothetical protein
VAFLKSRKAFAVAKVSSLKSRNNSSKSFTSVSTARRMARHIGCNSTSEFKSWSLYSRPTTQYHWQPEYATFQACSSLTPLRSSLSRNTS